MSSNSDHNKPQINLLQLLPDVYKSDINTSLTELAFDRHFTKDDVTRIAGYVGIGNPSAFVNRQIVEDTPHRQAFQLAPTMYTKVGTEETTLSFSNFTSQLELMGVDIDRLPKWASSLEFNWVPPINIDMLVNYQDYFWNSDDPINRPQYLTIENLCNKATDKVSSYELLMEARGLQFPIVDIDFTTNTFIVDGKWDHVFTAGFVFETRVSTITKLEGKLWNTLSVNYIRGSDKTQITVSDQLAPFSAPADPIVGDWWFDTTSNSLYIWNSIEWAKNTNGVATLINIPSLYSIQSISIVDNTITIGGKQDDIFVPGFVFATSNSTSQYLTSHFWTTATSVFDEEKYQTVITIIEPLAMQSEIQPSTPVVLGQWWYNPSTRILYEWKGGTTWNAIPQTVIGMVSLAEMLYVYKAELNCICSQDRGWDIGLWDDSSVGNIVWNTDLVASITHSTESAWIAANGDATPLSIWYDTSTNQLKQYGDLDHPLPSDPSFVPTWNVVANNFSAVLSTTYGTEQWDATTGCFKQVPNQWSTTNKWTHKTAIKSYSSTTRAQVPILEYDSRIELNKWTKLTRTWKYRATLDDPFEIVDQTPSRFDLEPIKGFSVSDVDGWSITLSAASSSMNRDIDYTSIFIPGYTFRIEDDANMSDIYTVEYSEYKEVNGELVTVVKLHETVYLSAIQGGGITNARIVPVKTSKGDLWLGYHIHWCLDATADVGAPTNPRESNIYKDQGSTQVTIIGNAQYAGFSPQVTSIIVGTAFQEFTVDRLGITTVDLMSSLQFNPASQTYYATPNSDELRVYINNERQYGTYSETVTAATPTYTMVGTDRVTNTTVSYVTGITFSPSVVLEMGDVVRIEVGVSAMDDMGLFGVPVRTVENDDIFSSEVLAGMQPIYRGLSTYVRREQVKSQLNQYPLFNVYDILTDDVVTASPIITFKEDSSAPINGNIQRRIFVAGNGTEYEFEQHLILEDNGVMYAYRNVAMVPATGKYWYSPLTSKVLYWTGDAWTDKRLVNGVFRSIRVSSTDPTDLWSKNGALWLNTNNSTMYQRSANTWVTIPSNSLIISDVDPSLQCIWKHGTNNEQYVPQYVDKDRQPIAVGSINGDWEVVKQWRYNSEHQNKKSIKFSQLVTHFKDIINSQTPVLGLMGGGVYSLAQNEYNYGIGGTIKEFNGAFDTLISAVNVTNATPVTVMEFASREYASELQVIQDIFNRSIIELFGEGGDSFVDFSTHIISSVISQYENNEFYGKVYHDTTAYNVVTNKGVKNWIATAPMLGLAPVYRPHLNHSGDIIQIFHHDGHRSNIVFTSVEADMFARKVISLTDARVSGYKMGAQGSTMPPATEQDFTNMFGGNGVRNGVFWYKIGTTKTFYRLSVYAVSPIHPSFYQDGLEVPNGVRYYNTTTHNVFKKNGLTWDIDTVYNSYDISTLWEEMNFRLMLGKLFLDIEIRLYEAALDTRSAFDYSTLITDDADQATYDAKYKKRFEEYVVQYSVSTPYVNTQYRQADPFSWNYIASTKGYNDPPIGATTPYVASWQSLYTTWYNTPYPNLEPWKLQGYHDKPIWWDDEYLDASLVRRWKYDHATTTGMWHNIKIGVVPSGRTYPDGRISTGNTTTDNQVLPTYKYFSVNIDDIEISGGYKPDDLLPPFYATDSTIIRSAFTNYGQIVSPNADYMFGDMSPIEWEWTISAAYPYEKPIIAFMMQPARFLRSTFGPMYTTIDKLEIDTTFKKVYSHKDTLFHGDMYDTNKVYAANGLNQWYVNYNRYSGFDTSGEFRSKWVEWTPMLTYQFGGIIDTSTLDISNKNMDIIRQDYNIVLANNGAIKDLWVDSFDVKILSIPPSIMQYNNQHLWKLELNSKATIARDIHYYDVKQYPFVVDTTTNKCTAYRYSIISVEPAANRFFVSGDETDVFVGGLQIVVSGSTNNNGNFSVVSSVYEPTINATRINVQQQVNFVADGMIGIDTFSLPWSNADMVMLSSTKFLPSPLVPNTPYYVVRNDTMAPGEFKLAETIMDAVNGITIDLASSGVGSLFVAEIQSSFNIMGGTSLSGELWYHYALDKSVVKTFTPPHTIAGMQTLINVIDGYAEYQRDQGLITNTASSSDFDPETGRLITWAVETERFIDWAYSLRSGRLEISDRYDVVANTSDNTLMFTSAIPNWTNGTAVRLMSTGQLPEPLAQSDVYYIVKTGTENVIKLSLTQDVSQTSLYVDITTLGSGNIYISVNSKTQSYPTFEMNPNRNNIWIEHPQGVLSDIVQGPYTDIRVRQTIFDQYGRAIDAVNLIPLRHDKRSRISVVQEIPNDVDRFLVNDPYNYIHIGGGHFFLEGYEHFLMFNPYTAGGVLIYDPFLGLATSKFELDFFKKDDDSMRPTLGGYYLNGHEFFRNIEGSAEDLHNYYDAYAGSEDSPSIKKARQLLGYNGRSDYLDILNVNSKSQFWFYRGMINAKGSVDSVMAYINSRKFVDAKIDDFWAVKIATFGDNNTKVYPEILLYASDSVKDDIRLEFVGLEDNVFDPIITNAVEKQGFNLVTFADDTRWNNFPEQRAEIVQPLFLDGEVTSLTRILVSTNPPLLSDIDNIDYWFDTSTNTPVLRMWNTSDWNTVVYNKIHKMGSYIYWRHAEPCDAVRVTRREFTITKLVTKVENIAALDKSMVVPGNQTHLFTTDVIFDVTNTLSNNGMYTVNNSLYDELLNVTNVFVVQNVVDEIVNGDITLRTTKGIISVDTATNSFVVLGDITNAVYGGTEVVVVGNTNNANNTTFVVESSVYDPDNNMTTINVTATVSTGIGGSLGYSVYDFNFFNSTHLIEGSLASDGFYRLNSEVVRFDTTAVNNLLHIYTIRPSVDKINPANLVDRESDTLVDRISLWHPAYGLHYFKAMHNIDIYSDVDPAKYLTTIDPLNASAGMWNFNEVGTTWLDTSSIGYVPYYDERIFPDINDRLYKWGDLAGYSNPIVYQWVRSLVHPSEWDKLATTQLGDLTIPMASKVTGNAKTTTFKRSRNTYPGTIRFNESSTVVTVNGLADVFENSETIFLTSNSKLPDNLDNGLKYDVLNASATNPQTFELAGISGAAITFDPISVTVTVVDNEVALVFQAATGMFTNGDIVRFTTIANGVLPTPLTTVDYVVENVLENDQRTYQTFTVTDGTNPVVVSTLGKGRLTATKVGHAVTIVPKFSETAWVKQLFAKQQLVAVYLDTLVNPTLTWTRNSTDPIWYVNDIVEIYVNGRYVDTRTLTVDNVLGNMVTIPTTLTVNEYDFIDIIRPIHGLTQAEIDFDPDVEDDGTILTQWKEDYEYTTVATTVGTTVQPQYYFWVKNSTVKSSSSDDMSIREINNTLRVMPDPYFIVQKPLDGYVQSNTFGYDQPSYGTYWDVGEVPDVFHDVIPVMYREAIIRNISQYIDSNSRYMIRFTRDLTLRDHTSTPMGKMLKNQHEEWMLIRRNQLTNIPRFLWDKLTESLVGEDANGMPIPSLDRVLYDDQQGTHTRFGMGSGQAFVDKGVGLATLLAYLRDPTRDFSPIDINDFMRRNDFNTKSGIKVAMDEIYQTFGSTAVNGIWFDILHDALVSKPRFKELFKTSWIALHGIQVLGVNGLFDE